tara:strand:+ start:1825 stop:2778 length:954 start_codon:yes stop_codon:yes gene_type:complete
MEAKTHAEMLNGDFNAPESDPPAPPRPGVFKNVDFDDYRSWPGIAASRLKLARLSPQHYARPADSVATESAAMRVGSLVHCAALEAGELATRYIVAPDFHREPENKTKNGTPTTSKNTAYVRQSAEAFRKRHADKTVISHAERDTLQSVIGSLRRDTFGRDLLTRDGISELSIYWKDKRTGLECKGRPDRVAGEWLIDVKTCRNLLDFPNDLARRLYHLQLSHYLDGLRTLTGKHYRAAIIAVENAAPYCSHTAEIDADTLAAGYALRDQLLATVKTCQKTGVWPGPAMPPVWRVPEWALTEDQPAELDFTGADLEV